MKACYELNEAAGDNGWNRQDLAHKLYPNADTSKKDNYIRVQLSILTKTLQHYIKEKSASGDQPETAILYLRSLKSRGLSKDFEPLFKKEKEDLGRISVKEYKDYTRILNLEEEKISLIEETGEEMHEHFFQESLDALEKAYLIKKLSLICKANSMDRGSKNRHSIHFQNELRLMATGGRFLNNELIQLYLALSQITVGGSKENDALFIQARDLYLPLLPQLKQWKDQDEVKSMFKYLANYCAIRINEKEQRFQGYLVKLYDDILGEGVLEDGKGVIESNSLKNIITTFVRVSGASKAKEFLHDYMSSVSDDSQGAKATGIYCKGIIAFFEKEYEQALKLAQNALILLKLNSNFQLELEIRAFSIRASYKIGDRAYTESQSKALIRLAKRKMGLEQLKQNSFRLFAEYQLKLSKALHAKAEIKEQKLKNLEKVLKENNERFYSKEWLKRELSAVL